MGSHITTNTKSIKTFQFNLKSKVIAAILNCKMKTFTILNFIFLIVAIAFVANAAATQLQDCCEKYNFNEKTEVCWDVLCGDKTVTCAQEPWVFFEKFPKKECIQPAKNIKSCCKLQPR